MKQSSIGSTLLVTSDIGRNYGNSVAGTVGTIKVHSLINFNEHIDTNRYEVIVNHLGLHQQSEIEKLIEKYKPAFAKDKYDIGTVEHYEAHMDFMVDKYCYKRPYRCTEEDRRQIETQISKLLEKNLIEESYSPFAAPVTLAYKKEDEKKNKVMYRFQRIK